MNLNQTFVSNCRIVMFFQIARRNVLDIKRITRRSCYQYFSKVEYHQRRHGLL